MKFLMLCLVAFTLTGCTEAIRENLDYNVRQVKAYDYTETVKFFGFSEEETGFSPSTDPQRRYKVGNNK